MHIEELQSPIEVPVQAFLTNSMQVADILDRILSYIGPSEIWQSTFSVSEEFLRRLYILRRDRKITASHVVLDLKASRKIVRLWPFISQVYESAFLAENHSKILLLSSVSGHRVAVVTSQNLTRGNRYESTIVTSIPQIYRSLLQSMQDLTKFHSVPLNDLFGRRT